MTYIVALLKLPLEVYTMYWIKITLRFIELPSFCIFRMLHFNQYPLADFLILWPSGWSVPDDTTPASGAVHYAGQPLSVSGSKAWETTLHRWNRCFVVDENIGVKFDDHFFFTVYSTYTCTCNYVKWVIHSEIWFCLFVLVCHLLIYTNHVVHVLCFWCISSNLYSCYSFRAPRACGRPVVRVHRPRNHAPVLWADSEDPGTVQPCCQTAHHRYWYRRKHIT